MKAAIVSDGRPWAKIAYQEASNVLPDRSVLVFHEPGVITEHADVLFFPFYSKKVLPGLIEARTCIGFHMTDLPYGRGGSPLQNLIVRGYERTKICAFRLIDEMDAGPIYLTEDLALAGSAEEIYVRAGRIIGAMIPKILANIQAGVAPTPQSGNVVTWKRRVPEQSAIDCKSEDVIEFALDHVFDHIRMLDAEGYPHAFIEKNGLRYEFTNAVRRHDRVEAIVTIREIK